MGKVIKEILKILRFGKSRTQHIMLAFTMGDGFQDGI
jgi:hypothetical protein